jgi:hypothetical protein
MTSYAPPEPEAPPEQQETTTFPEPNLNREIVSGPPDLEYPTAPEEAYTSAPDDIYVGISSSPVTAEQEEILKTPARLEQIEITPAGEAYVPHAEYRRVLCAAFHPGGWAIRPLGKPTLWGNWLMQWYALYVGGRYISSAPAEARYFPDNPRMVYATALESLRSVALRRLCKDLGVFLELWNRDFVKKFISEHCIQVEYLGYENKVVKGWRRKESPPIPGETELAELRARARRKFQEKSQAKPEQKHAPIEAEVQQVTQTTAEVKPEPACFTEGVLEYRNAAGIKEVKVNGTWKVADATLGTVTQESRDKVLALFEVKGNPDSRVPHFQNYCRKYFAKTTLAALTWEELAVLLADKRDGKPDPRFIQREEKAEAVVETAGPNWEAFKAQHPGLSAESITSLKELVASGNLEFGSEAFNLAVHEAVLPF